MLSLQEAYFQLHNRMCQQGRNRPHSGRHQRIGRPVGTSRNDSIGGTRHTVPTEGLLHHQTAGSGALPHRRTSHLGPSVELLPGHEDPQRDADNGIVACEDGMLRRRDRVAGVLWHPRPHHLRGLQVRIHRIPKGAVRFQEVCCRTNTVKILPVRFLFGREPGL